MNNAHILLAAALFPLLSNASQEQGSIEMPKASCSQAIGSSSTTAVAEVQDTVSGDSLFIDDEKVGFFPVIVVPQIESLNDQDQLSEAEDTDQDDDDIEVPSSALDKGFWRRMVWDSESPNVWCDTESSTSEYAMPPISQFKKPISLTFRDYYLGNKSLGVPAHKDYVDSYLNKCHAINLIGLSLCSVRLKSKKSLITRLILSSLDGLDEIPELAKISQLSVSNQDIETFPDVVDTLQNNPIDFTTPQQPSQLASITEEILASAPAPTLYEEIRIAINELHELEKKARQLGAINAWLVNANLARLQHTFRTYKPIAQPKFTGLVTLSLINNKISILPESICKLVTLRQLILVDNQIRVLPETFTNLTNLEMLNLHSNCLESVPDSIGELVCLEQLILERNRLETIPATISQLRALKKLHLADNRITRLPNIKCLYQLISMSLLGNPIMQQYGISAAPILQYALLQHYNGQECMDDAHFVKCSQLRREEQKSGDSSLNADKDSFIQDLERRTILAFTEEKEIVKADDELD